MYAIFIFAIVVSAKVVCKVRFVPEPDNIRNLESERKKEIAEA
jgi:hypothetical protein